MNRIVIMPFSVTVKNSVTLFNKDSVKNIYNKTNF